MSKSDPCFEIAIPVYNNLRVNVFTRRKAMRKWFEARSLSDCVEELNFAGGYAAWSADPNGHHWFTLFVPRSAAVDTVAHECLHTAWNILEAVGIRVEFSNHETLAYLQQYLVREVLEGLKNISAT